MRFTKFTISNYRAVEHAELPVSNNLIPIVGINESGKTTILQAVLAFDRLSDTYGGGTHLHYKNKYELGTHTCSISADVLIDSEEEIASISQKLRLPMGHEVLEGLKELYRSGGTLRITRSFSEEGRSYQVSGISVPGELNDKLAKEIYRLLPQILYFDDFTDRVPASIRFNRADNQKGYKLVRSRQPDWHRIIEEIFKRSTNGQYTLSDFIDMTDGDDQQGLLHDIKDVLNQEIIEDWHKLKKYGDSLRDDPADLALELKYIPKKGSFEFEFKVHDRSKERLRVFNVTERSKGLQWFFNFLMKLKFNPKYTKDQSGAIYLLDEPGSYLHSSAQTELIHALRDISEMNSIVYCTHSQHLLDPEVTNIGQIRIAEKADGVVNIYPIGSAKIVNDQGALTPVFHALHLKTGTFNRDVKKAVITEGITDYYFFRMLMNYADPFNLEIDLIPGAGAGQLRELISFSIAWADAYLVLLDSDRQGVREYNRYIRIFGQEVADNFYRYALPGQDNNVVLEDFLAEEDKERLREVTGIDDVKRALPAIYYMKEDVKRAFIEELGRDTMANLSLVQQRLRALADL